MGNYRDVETEFIERTLGLISQYEVKMHDYEFDQQFNHTLLVNCLLGLIVFPKEKTLSFLPKARIHSKLKEEMGISLSSINSEIIELKELIIHLRHSIAHFDIIFKSEDQTDFKIDRIIFMNSQGGKEIASFVPIELLGFIRYYSGWLLCCIRDRK